MSIRGMQVQNTAERDLSSPEWYLLYTNPKQEDRTERNLSAWSVETFAPRVKTRYYNQFTGKPSLITKPLFPRYVFARFSIESHLHKVQFTRGVQDVVSFGDGPTRVSAEIVEFLRLRVKPDGRIASDDDFEAGDRVTIVGGPLAGLTGIFEWETKDAERVCILLEAISYQAHTGIDRNMLRSA